MDECRYCHKPVPEDCNEDLHDWTPSDPEPENAWIFSFYDGDDLVEEAVCQDCVKRELRFVWSEDFYETTTDKPTIVEG